MITQKDIIFAWYQGAKLQVFKKGYWKDTIVPIWNTNNVYRIKKESKPEIIRYATLGTYKERTFFVHKHKNSFSQIELTFDGETKVLKAVKLVNNDN